MGSPIKQAEISAHDHLPSSRVRDAARLLSKIIFKAKYRVGDVETMPFSANEENHDPPPNPVIWHLRALSD